MEQKIVFLCSGQGSQFFNMAIELYRHNEEYHTYLNDLNDYAYEITGVSVLDYIFDEKKNAFSLCDNLQLTSLALLIYEYSLGKVLMNHGLQPDCIVGSSMGEIAAYMLSSPSEIFNCMYSTVMVAKAIEGKCDTGGMMAVLAEPDYYEEIKKTYSNCELVGINYDKHFVIAGTKEELREIASQLAEKKIITQLLPVNYAFHSAHMHPIREIIAQHEFKGGMNIPIGSCAYGKIITSLPVNYLWSVLRSEIKFEQTIEQVKNKGTPVFIDIGPNGTLSNFIKRKEGNKYTCYSIIDMFHKENENLKSIFEVFNLK